MRYFHCILIILLSISTNAYSYQPKVEIIEHFDNLKIIAFISMEDIKSNPEWNPDLDAPPLTIAEAIHSVKTFIKKTGSIKEIEIRQVPKHEKQWHYLIRTANDSMESKYSIYVVLMNGKVIPAIIEPQSYK